MLIVSLCGCSYEKLIPVVDKKPSNQPEETPLTPSETPTPPVSPFIPKKILIIAHRGDKRNAPENTIPAFKLALKEKADMVD